MRGVPTSRSWSPRLLRAAWLFHTPPPPRVCRAGLPGRQSLRLEILRLRCPPQGCRRQLWEEAPWGPPDSLSFISHRGTADRNRGETFLHRRRGGSVETGGQGAGRVRSPAVSSQRRRAGCTQRPGTAQTATHGRMGKPRCGRTVETKGRDAAVSSHTRHLAASPRCTAE